MYIAEIRDSTLTWVWNFSLLGFSPWCRVHKQYTATRKSKMKEENIIVPVCFGFLVSLHPVKSQWQVGHDCVPLNCGMNYGGKNRTLPEGLSSSTCGRIWVLPLPTVPQGNPWAEPECGRVKVCHYFTYQYVFLGLCYCAQKYDLILEVFPSDRKDSSIIQWFTRNVKLTWWKVGEWVTGIPIRCRQMPKNMSSGVSSLGHLHTLGIASWSTCQRNCISTV